MPEQVRVGMIGTSCYTKVGVNQHQLEIRYEVNRHYPRGSW
jgi:hypothetical protein